MTAVLTSHAHVDGVGTTRYQAPHARRLIPIVMVHGAWHASWVWRYSATHLARAGWTCHAVDWLHHGHSARLPPRQFLHRGVRAVAEHEIAVVDAAVSRRAPDVPIILIGHGMGALAAALYASLHPHRVHSLVLISPAGPMHIRVEALPIPDDFDFGRPVPPPRYEEAKRLLFPAMAGEQVADLYPLLESESPRAIWEAAHWTTWIDLDAITARVLVIAAVRDRLWPPATAERFAQLLRGDFRAVPQAGHTDVLLADTVCDIAARDIAAWLDPPRRRIPLPGR